jgi:hypothetical protein
LAEDCIIDDIDVILVAIRRTVDPMLFKQKNKKLCIFVYWKKNTQKFSHWLKIKMTFTYKLFFFFFQKDYIGNK